MKRKICIGIIFVLAVWLINITYKEITDFSLANITMEIPEHLKRNPEIPPPDEQIKIREILNQPFTYLGKGNQTYAFESKDKKYVLKFFKFGHLKPSFLFGQSSGQKKRIERIFSSHRIADELDKGNAGLIYVHLDPTDFLHMPAKLTDRFHFSHLIDLDSAIFVLQEKAIPSKDLISMHLDRGNVKGATALFKSLIALYQSEYAQGIYDQDHNLMHNTGFIAEKAVRFDVGKMAKDHRMKEFQFAQEDLNKVIDIRIDKWLKRYYPLCRDEIMSAIRN